MPKIRVPLADKQNNRSYLNTADYILLNAYIERNAHGLSIVKRPGFTKLATISTIVTEARAIVWSPLNQVYYILIGDGLFSFDVTFGLVTEIARKTPTSASWAAGSATYNFASAHGFTAGQKVRVSGITGSVIPDGYIGVLTIATAAANSFTVVMPDPGIATLLNARVSPILSSTGAAYFETVTNGSHLLHIPYAGINIPGAPNAQLLNVNGTATLITDSDLPAYTVGQGVFMDGYYFLLSNASILSGGAQIYNSDLEVMTSWNSLGFVTAEMSHEMGVSLAKHHNQLVCFKEKSIEFFYNAANPAPASPLSRIAAQNVNLGCAAAESISSIEDNVFFVSRDQNSGLGVHVLSGGSPVKISTSFIDRILSASESIIELGYCRALSLSFEGHRFYVLNIEGTLKRTLVYDLAEKEWSEWSSNDGANNQVAFFSNLCISGHSNDLTHNYQNAIMVDKSNGDIYELSPPPLGSANPTTYKDGSQYIKVKIVTNTLDGGTRNRKRCNSLEFIGDMVNTTISTRYSDDDYQTWSGLRTVSLAYRARLNNLGSFRRRAFEFTMEDDKPLRLSAIELDVVQGTR